MQIKKDFPDKYLSCYACIEIDDELWISNARYNGLFKYSIDQKTLQFIGIFDSQPEGWSGIHNCIEQYDDELFFFPLMGDAIDVYNIKENSFSSIKPEGWERRKAAVAAVYIKKRHAYIFMKNSASCFLLSLPEHKILEEIFMPNVNRISLPGSKIIEGTVLIGERVYFPIQGTTYLACFDLSTQYESVIEVNYPVPFIGAIACINKNIVVSDAANNIVIIDSVNYSTSTIQFDWDGNEKEIVAIVPVCDDIIIVPAKLGKIAVWNSNDGSIDYFINNSICRLEDTIMKWRDIGRAVLKNGNIILCPIGMDSFIRLDPANKVFDSFPIKIENYRGTSLENRYSVRNERKGYLEIFLKQILS